MKISRGYQVLPDRATCHQPICCWHCKGNLAKVVLGTHGYDTGHEAWVTIGARLIWRLPGRTRGRPHRVTTGYCGNRGFR